MSLPPVAVTMGEPAGIGGEITCRAWLGRNAGLPPFFLLDDPKRISALARRLDLAVPVRAIQTPEAAEAVFAEGLPVLPQPIPNPVEPGRLDPANAVAVRAAIETAVALTTAGRASAVVTNPLHKDVMYRAGFSHPGHTEFLAELAGGATPVMMLACPGLRVVPVTIHVALADVPRLLTRDLLVETGRITAAALTRDFGVDAPRLVVAGLNPHAGESGGLGREEIEVIGPALDILRAEGIDVTGPLPADTLFHARARAGYDAALCMYHDQALIPVKTVDFDRGVNVTLGLPFVRTSPDHGTALNIAGSGTANPESLIEALRMAATMAANRDG